MTCACGTTTSKQRICSSIGTARCGSSILRECVAFKIASGCGNDKSATSTIFSIRATGGKIPLRRNSSAVELLKTPAVRETLAGSNGAEHPLANRGRRKTALRS